MSTKCILVLAIAASALTSSAALAATGTPERVRGVIASAAANSVTVDSYAGKPVTVGLTDKTAYLKVEKSSLDKIDKGSFIGTATKDVGGTQVALEVVIFPPSMRGTGEGHYPWDLQPESTMTNATVSTLAESPKGREMSLTFKGENNKVIVPAGVPIVTFEPGDKAMLKPGAKVFVGTTKGADGTLTAARVNVGKDGLTPPM